MTASGTTATATVSAAGTAPQRRTNRKDFIEAQSEPDGQEGSMKVSAFQRQYSQWPDWYRS